jgi:NAD(P)-dependent dehydrogenase (short-subunit alcohol dehydrogenase family)
MRDGGSIILTSSISAIMGTPFEGLYGATKAGVSALAGSAAIDLGSREIRVNAVQPGPTWTDMNPMPERLLEILAPAGRKGRVEDLTGVYEFLARPPHPGGPMTARPRSTPRFSERSPCDNLCVTGRRGTRPSLRVDSALHR